MIKKIIITLFFIAFCIIIFFSGWMRGISIGVASVSNHYDTLCNYMEHNQSGQFCLIESEEQIYQELHCPFGKFKNNGTRAPTLLEEIKYRSKQPIVGLFLGCWDYRLL